MTTTDKYTPPARSTYWYPTGTLAAPYLPQEVSDLQLAFPAGISDLLPPAADIPDEFCEHRGTEWNKIVTQWFFNGLPATTDFEPAEGVDPKAALRHISVIMGSFEPKHEYKEAAIAYLLSLWFKSVTGWDKREPSVADTTTLPRTDPDTEEGRYCPKCGADWRASEIPREQIERGGYGHREPCPRTDTYDWDKHRGYDTSLPCECPPRFYGRLIGIEIPRKYDGISEWLCPDCGTRWDRWTREEIVDGGSIVAAVETA